MKPSIFLLATTLISAPFALGQTAPVAVQAPVASAATAMPTDAELQAKVDSAAQVLAKLPANTPGFAMAQERVATARASILTPVTFSLGQSGRQAHLVLGNLRSARVWCQINEKTALEDDKALLNKAIAILQNAEDLAQQKVDVMNKPDDRTTEQILADAKRLVEESDAFSKLSKEQALASDNELKKMREDDNESVRKFQETQAAFDALPKPVPVDEKQMQLQAEEQQRVEEALSQRSELGRKHLDITKDYISKIDTSFELVKQLHNPGLTASQRDKIKAKIAIADKEMNEAKAASKSALEKLRESHERVKELLNAIPLKKDAALRVPFSCFLTRNFRLIQDNPPTEGELLAKVIAARVEITRTLAAQDIANAKLDEIQKALTAKDSASESATQAQTTYNLYYGIAQGLAKDALNAQAAWQIAKATTTAAQEAAAKAQKAFDDANAALNAALIAADPNKNGGVCVDPNIVRRLRDALTVARTALEKANAAVATVKAAEAAAKATADNTSYNANVAKTTAENAQESLQAALNVLTMDIAAYQNLGGSAGLAAREAAAFAAATDFQEAAVAFQSAISAYTESYGELPPTTEI